MNVKSIGMCAMAVLLSASCARQEKTSEINVDGNGIPAAVSDLLPGDSCRIDTLYAGDDNVYMFIDDIENSQKILFDRYGLISCNPMLSVDSLTATSYRVGDLISSIVVDFSIDENVEQLRKIFPFYEDFKTVIFRKAQTEPFYSTFSLCVSSPDEKVKNSADIKRWVASQIDTVPFTGSFEAMGENMAKKMNEDAEGTQSPGIYEDFTSLIYWKTDDYVTYFNTSSIYLGGAHPMYTFNFPTYLTKANRRLTRDYILNSEFSGEIRELIYESFLADTDFASNHNINSVSQLKSYISANIYGEALPIPDPGLLAGGAVFCYQPYDVGSYIDGAFQIVIPYEKLEPYMTDAGKKLIP